MRNIALIVFLVFLPGCARVLVETKDPIKVDISMRLDIYQHVLRDVEAIEEQIYGQPEKKMNFLFTVSKVYAADSVETAIKRRRDRVSEIEEYFNSGYIGENRSAYLEVLVSEAPDKLKRTIKQENQDRQIIYEDTARKNNAPLGEVKKVFFNNHYSRAQAGWYFEVYDSSTGRYSWKQK